MSKTTPFTVRLTLAQAEELKEIARRCGTTAGDVMRYAFVALKNQWYGSTHGMTTEEVDRWLRLTLDEDRYQSALAQLEEDRRQAMARGAPVTTSRDEQVHEVGSTIAELVDDEPEARE